MLLVRGRLAPLVARGLAIHTGRATASGTVAFVERNNIKWPFSLPNPAGGGEGSLMLSRVGFGSPWQGNPPARRAAQFAGLLTDRQASNLLMLDEIGEIDMCAWRTAKAKGGDWNIDGVSKLWQKDMLDDALLGSAVQREELVLVGSATLPTSEDGNLSSEPFVSQAVSSYLSIYELESLDLLQLTLPPAVATAASVPGCNNLAEDQTLTTLLNQLENEVSAGRLQGYGFRCDHMTLALCELLATTADKAAASKAGGGKSALLALQYPLNPLLDKGPEASVAEFAQDRGWVQIVEKALDADIRVQAAVDGEEGRWRQRPVRFVRVEERNEVRVAEKLHNAFNETLHLESRYDAMLDAVKKEMEGKSSSNSSSEVDQVVEKVVLSEVVNTEKEQLQGQSGTVGEGKVLTQNLDLAVDKRDVHWGNVLLNNRQRLAEGGLYEWQVIRQRTIMPQLQAALKLLGQSESKAAKEWALLYIVAVGRLLDSFTALLEVDAAKEVKEAALRLDQCAPALSTSATLRDKALRFALSAGGDVVLCEDDVAEVGVQGAEREGEGNSERPPTLREFAQEVTELSVVATAECDCVSSNFQWPQL